MLTAAGSHMRDYALGTPQDTLASAEKQEAVNVSRHCIGHPDWATATLRFCLSKTNFGNRGVRAFSTATAIIGHRRREPHSPTKRS